MAYCDRGHRHFRVRTYLECNALAKRERAYQEKGIYKLKGYACTPRVCHFCATLVPDTEFMMDLHATRCPGKEAAKQEHAKRMEQVLQYIGNPTRTFMLGVDPPYVPQPGGPQLKAERGPGGGDGGLGGGQDPNK